MSPAIGGFLAGNWVSALAATALASRLALGSLSTFAALLATRCEILWPLIFCVNADAATDFTPLLTFLFASTLAADLETLLDVFSELDMSQILVPSRKRDSRLVSVKEYSKLLQYHIGVSCAVGKSWIFEPCASSCSAGSGRQSSVA